MQLTLIANIYIYMWVIPLTDKKGGTITNAFQKILDESKHKPSKANK